MKPFKLLRLIYPMHCPQCGQIIPFGDEICSCYKSAITPTLELCHNCGQNKNECICELKQTIHLKNFTSPYFYDGLIRAKLHQMKFNSVGHEAQFFFQPMAQKFVKDFPDAEIDVVCFVPMTHEAIKQRGFNQSKLLASGVSKILSCPCRSLLKKQFETKPQHVLKSNERQNNLEGSFEIEENVENLNILLVDDIKTTGATLKTCASILQSHGAKNIYFLTAAVTKFQADIF